MQTDIITQIKLLGKPLSLSTGVPLMRGYPATPALHAFSAQWGEAQLELAGAHSGPGTSPWSGAWSRPQAAGDEEECERLRVWEDGRTVPFTGLSSTSLYWASEKKKPTHLLMDIRNRRLVGVVPWPLAVPDQPEPAWINISPWAQLRDLMDGTAPPPPEEYLGLRPALDEVDAAGKREIFACLHPAPIGPSGCALWAFDGLAWVRIKHPAPGLWEQALEDACPVKIPRPRFCG